VLSLVAGFGTDSVWKTQRTLSLCDIEANPEKYAGQTVRLRVVVWKHVLVGNVIDRELTINACVQCAGKDVLTCASVDENAGQLDLRETIRVQVGDRQWQDGRNYLTDAILIGRFEPPPGITGCFGPKYHIFDARIERLMATREFENYEQGVQWLKSNSR
jgi:hypothetical protein